MPDNVFRTNKASEFFTAERCHIIEILNREGTGFSIAQARVEPGVTTALHALKGIQEAYYILEGQGMMEVANSKAGIIKPGDVVVIAEGEPQRIANNGNQDLVFLCICSPRFALPAYIDLENER